MDRGRDLPLNKFPTFHSLSIDTETSDIFTGVKGSERGQEKHQWKRKLLLFTEVNGREYGTLQLTGGTLETFLVILSNRPLPDPLRDTRRTCYLKVPGSRERRVDLPEVNPTRRAI